MPRLIPAAWTPPSPGVRRIICHWSAGGHYPSDIDREHYHVLIDLHGHPTRGDHAILDNLNTADGDYAAHTRGLNTGSVGIAVCAMLGAEQSPLHWGKYPVTREQWNSLIIACADLCEAYRITPSRQTLLMHCEAEAFLAKPQSGKWDIAVLPFALHAGYRTPGEELRGRVAKLLGE